MHRRPFRRMPARMQELMGTQTTSRIGEKWEVVIQLILAAIATGAVIVAAIALVFTYRQVRLQTEAVRQQISSLDAQKRSLDAQNLSLQAQVWQTINAQYFELSKVQVDHPKLMPYFRRGKTISRKNKDYELVMAVADLYLDSIDAFADDYVRKLPGMENGGKYWVMWEKYFQDTFALSPALCARYKEVREWYGPELGNYAEKGCGTKASK